MERVLLVGLGRGVLCLGDDLLDEGPQGFRLGQRGLDATVGDERDGEIGHHRAAVFDGHAQGSVVFVMTHGVVFLAAPDRQSGRSVGRQRTARGPN